MEIIQKVNKLETHDRLQHFTTQDFDIGRMCESIARQDPFEGHKFYLFAHTRTEDSDPGTKRFIWQPRLTKPQAQSNSMLFKVNPKYPEEVKIIWILPPHEMWYLYEGATMFANDIISESIGDYKSNRRALESPEEDDLSEETMKAIYRRRAYRNPMQKSDVR